MKDLIERLKTDLNDPSKENEPFILNWTEAVVRRLWERANIGDPPLDAELIELGKAAAKRVAKRLAKRRECGRSMIVPSKSCSSL